MVIFMLLFSFKLQGVNVTFQVDMSQMVVSPLGVHLAGDFQGWDPSLTLMTDMGGGIYAITIDLPPGSYTFKFINGNAWGMDETVPPACGLDDGGGIFNRSVTIVDDTTLAAICFGQCNLCQPASFVMNGNAIALGGDCYQVTPGISWQNGAFWSNTQVDLNSDFDFQFTLNLGVNDANGADGVVFVLQRLGSSAIGASGGGMGYSSFGTSLGVEFDTFYNPEFNDPPEDHIAIELNGIVDHFTLENIGLPVQMSSTNANTEDGLDHVVGITWKASTQTISVYFDCILRVQSSYDLINNVFGGQSLVFWGFTGATGVFYNFQSVCALPDAMQTEMVDICPGSSATLNAGSSIDGIYSWTPATFLDDASIASPVASPPDTLVYEVSYQDLCNMTVTKQVTVNVLENGPACFFLPVSLVHFFLEVKNETVYFFWTSSDEKENAYYTIESSIDGVNFTSVAMVTGAGSSISAVDYSATSQHQNHDTYYRLQQHDVNGIKQIIGTTHFVKGKLSNHYRVRYDRGNNVCQVFGLFPGGNCDLSLYSLLGQSVSQNQITAASEVVSVEMPMDSGAYLIVLRDEFGTLLFREKIIVAN